MSGYEQEQIDENRWKREQLEEELQILSMAIADMENVCMDADAACQGVEELPCEVATYDWQGYTRDAFRDSYETYADYYNTYAKSVEEIKSTLNILYYEKEQERRALSEIVTEMSAGAGRFLY